MLHPFPAAAKPSVCRAPKQQGSDSLEEDDPGTGGGSSSPEDLRGFFGAEEDSDDPCALDEALEAAT